MKIITICGSLKFQEDMMTVAEKLGLEGNCILTPVYPVLKDNYIGESTKLEIKFAKKTGKEINNYK